MSDASPYALPNLEEIFGRLRRGGHICAEDGNIYHILRDHLEAFRDLFRHLGFRLEQHPRDFFYFRGDDKLSDTSARMAVFVYILMEYLEGKGEPVVEGILTRTFALEDLPHLTTERYRLYMKEAGIENEDDLEKVINSLAKLGFTQWQGRNFRFRSPVYRFFDVCLRVMGTELPEQAKGAAEE